MGQVGKLSEVERTMIKRLWEEGEPDFPRVWVRSSELLTDTGGGLTGRRKESGKLSTILQSPHHNPWARSSNLYTTEHGRLLIRGVVSKLVQQPELTS